MIEKVIKCDVVNFGNNVNLVTEVKVPRGGYGLRGICVKTWEILRRDRSSPSRDPDPPTILEPVGQPKQEEI